MKRTLLHNLGSLLATAAQAALLLALVKLYVLYRGTVTVTPNEVVGGAIAALALVALSSFVNGLISARQAEADERGIPVIRENEVPIIGFQHNPPREELQRVMAVVERWTRSESPGPLVIGGGGRIIGVREVPAVRAIEKGTTNAAS